MSGFSYEPCEYKGANGIRGHSCSTGHFIHDCKMPFIQREPLRRAIHQYWESEGTETNLSLLPDENQSGCPNDCSGNGVCNEKTGVCTCDIGFTGCDCNSKYRER